LKILTEQVGRKTAVQVEDVVTGKCLAGGEEPEVTGGQSTSAGMTATMIGIEGHCVRRLRIPIAESSPPS
jgi:hypothetical protein